jgi:hypothetical protein
MSFLYAFRLNWALEQLGIDVRIVNQTPKNAARLIGQSSGQTPQEVALLLLTQMPAEFQNLADAKVIRKWIRARKIRPEHQLVAEALQAVSFWNPEVPWRVTEWTPDQARGDGLGRP